MATRRSRLRVTIASLMALIAALSLIFLVVAPLVRLGQPPCLQPLPMTRWLVARPGAARCTDCHANPAAANIFREDAAQSGRSVRFAAVAAQ
jgi:hypothetical protein